MPTFLSATTVVIVDDHPIVCEGIKMLLDNDPDMEVVGTAMNIPQACEIISDLRPDVVLLDIDLNSVSAVDHIEELIACSPKSKILVLAGQIDGEANRAAELGAVGVVSKNDASATLIMAIQKIRKGEVWFDRAFTAKVMQSMSKRNTAERQAYNVLAKLTSREYEIAMKIGQGLVNKDIAQQLGISEKTVRNCLTIIYEKLAVTGRLELALFLSKNNYAAIQ